jgi:hypothetical protein
MAECQKVDVSHMAELVKVGYSAVAGYADSDLLFGHHSVGLQTPLEVQCIELNECFRMIIFLKWIGLEKCTLMSKEYSPPNFEIIFRSSTAECPNFLRPVG